MVTFCTTWMSGCKGLIQGLRPSIIWSIREPDVQATLENFVVCFVQNRRGPGGTFETHSQRDLWYFCPVIDYRRAKRAVRAWDLIASNVFALITSRRHLRRLWRSIPPWLLIDSTVIVRHFCGFHILLFIPFLRVINNIVPKSDVYQQY